MKRTSRSIRLLEALRDHPGSNNRALGRLAGDPGRDVDDGQLSKLLKRLEAQAAIGRDSSGKPLRGAPNCWYLLPLGAKLIDAPVVDFEPGPEPIRATLEERRVIETLRRLEKRWPDSLYLSPAVGSLTVMRYRSEDDGFGDLGREYSLATIEIPGDW